MAPPFKFLTATISLSVAFLLSSCSSYKDDEQSNYYKDAISSILGGKDEKYRPNKVVYIENPKVPPSRVTAGTYRTNAPQSQLDEIFFPYVLRQGFTVACAEDKEKNSLAVVLSHNGIYQTFGMYPLGGFVSIQCKSRANQ